MSNSINKEFEDLIIGYINQTSTIEDLKTIIEKLKQPKNISLFKAYIKINYYSIYIMNQSDTESIIKELKSRISKEKSKAKRPYILLNTIKYAAVFCLIFGLGYYSSINSELLDEPQKIIPKSNDIVLTSEDSKVVLEKDDNKTDDKKIISKINLIQKSDQLIYDNNIDIKELVYHSLKVPYGKRFNVVFSDGSKAYLNSGSVIRYPVKFIEDKKREVFLEGEAFFDVAENKNELFIVNSNGINVEVYGTKFNVRNYSEDFNSDIVLVEGSVGIKNAEVSELTMLKPGFKGSVDKENFRVKTSKVNTKIYTSWIDGEVIFRNETFSQILKKLERLYNVTIINNKNESLNEVFNAAINVENENIEQVLDYFNKIYNIEYQIFNNKIIIN
ncbi:MAG: FecR family protein [Flavobacteriaceae bacterium]|tara:strand:+ start:397 stop:1560 length:1164 start_codon:yes stop_codon:yes gene_type:complete